MQIDIAMKQNIYVKRWLHRDMDASQMEIIPMMPSRILTLIGAAAAAATTVLKLFQGVVIRALQP